MKNVLYTFYVILNQKGKVTFYPKYKHCAVQMYFVHDI